MATSVLNLEAQIRKLLEWVFFVKDTILLSPTMHFLCQSHKSNSNPISSWLKQTLISGPLSIEFTTPSCYEAAATIINIEEEQLAGWFSCHDDPAQLDAVLNSEVGSQAQNLLAEYSQPGVLEQASNHSHGVVVIVTTNATLLNSFIILFIIVVIVHDIIIAVYQEPSLSTN